MNETIGNKSSDRSRPRKTLLRTKDVVIEYGLAKRTLERWRSLGEGPPFVNIAGGVYYHREAFDAWFLARSG